MPVIAHQPHEAGLMLGPFAKGKGNLKLPNLRYVRCATHLDARPSHDRKDFSTCIPLNQEDPDISTQLM